MYRVGKNVLLLLLVGLVTVGLLSSRVDAQRYKRAMKREYKSGWYVDPIFSSPSSSGVGSSYASGYPIDAACPSCGIPGHSARIHGDAYGTLGSAGEVLVDPGSLAHAMPQAAILGAASGTGSAANCPPPTNALLRVWVDDHATVWVNGVKTKPQRLGGVHRGSRIFSLTGLVRDEIREALVEVEMFDGFHGTSNQEKTQSVQAGGSYELRFQKMVNFEGGLPHGEVELNPHALAPQPLLGPVPATPPDAPIPELGTNEGIPAPAPALDADVAEAAAERLENSVREVEAVTAEAKRNAQAAADAAENAKTSATEAQVEAEKAKKTSIEAEEEAGKAKQTAEEAEAAAARAKAAADASADVSKKAAERQALLHAEFVLEGNGEAMVARIKYIDDGRLEKWTFDAETRKQLVYRETSGALANLSDVTLKMIYRVTIQVPDAQNQGSFKDALVVDLPANEEATFDQGEASVEFYDVDEKDEHLSSRLRNLLIDKWRLTPHENGRVKVEIIALRRNGTEMAVAPEGNRITIAVSERP